MRLPIVILRLPLDLDVVAKIMQIVGEAEPTATLAEQPMDGTTVTYGTAAYVVIEADR